MAHLHLGLLAYRIVNTVRCKLKANCMISNWQEIVRIGNTQKIITTHGTNLAGANIGVRKCSEPSGAAKKHTIHPAIKAKTIYQKKICNTQTGTQKK